MKRTSKKGGFTLVEIMVCLAVLAIMLGIATRAINSTSVRDDSEEWVRRVVSARAASIRDATPLVIWPDSEELGSPVLLLPDGRMLGRGFAGDSVHAEPRT